MGRYGPYLQRGEDRVSIPEDLAPDELTVERAEALLEAPSSDRVLGEDPETGLPVQVRAGRFGPYVQLGELVDGGPKPRTSSLFASMSAGHPDPRAGPGAAAGPPGGGHRPRHPRGDRGPQRQVRAVPEEGDRYPQPRHRGSDPARSPSTRPWPCSPSPKTRGGRNAKGPLREMGADPDTGLAMVVKDGRFGPYVTDGTTNASLRRGDDVEDLTVERAAELLAERRAAGPSTGRRRRRRRRPAKKAAAKKGSGQEGPGQEEGGGQKTRPRRRQRAQEAADHGRTRRGPVVRWVASGRGPPHRPRGDRRLRKVHPGPAAGRATGGRADLRAGGHTALGRRCGALLLDRIRAGWERGRGAADGRRPRPARGRGGHAGPRRRDLGGDRPVLGLDHGLPGLRAGPRPRGRWPSSSSGPPPVWRPTSTCSSTCRWRWGRPRARGSTGTASSAGGEFQQRVADGYQRSGRRRPPRRGWWSTAPARWTRWPPRCGRGSGSAGPGRWAMAAERKADRGERGRPACGSAVRGGGGPAPGGSPADGGRPPTGARLPAARAAGVGQAGRGPRLRGRALLCPDGGCGVCNTCRRALGRDPPRPGGGGATGAALDVDEARTIVRPGPTSPARSRPPGADGHRRPPGRAGGARLAQDGGGATAGDRVRAGGRRPSPQPGHHCQPVRADPVRPRLRRGGGAWLVGHGVEPTHARIGGQGLGGTPRPGPPVGQRPRLRGPPGPVAVGSFAGWTAPVPPPPPWRPSCWARPRRRWHRCGPSTQQELVTLAEQAEWPGARGSRAQAGGGGSQAGGAALAHRRPPVRAGHAGRVYRDRLMATTSAGGETDSRSGRRGRRAVRQVDAISEASVALDRNANESLLMDALMVELSGIGDRSLQFARSRVRRGAGSDSVPHPLGSSVGRATHS